MPSRRPTMRAVGAADDYLQTRSRRDDLAAALRAMEQRLAAMVEDRRQLTRDLHDCVLQSLYAIGLTIESTRRSSAGRAPDAGTSGEFAADQLNRLIHDVRGMIRSLESGRVQDFDLPSELQSLINTYRHVSSLHISTDIGPGVIAMATNEEKREVLMIVREAVSNCVRHARATRATISLYAKGSRLRLLVTDDGIGFTQEGTRTKGYGLANMGSRAKKLGGRLLVRSQIGKGTRILVECMLEPGLPPVR